MAAYGKDDFVFSFDDYDFSDFSDFSDDPEGQKTEENKVDTDIDEDDFQPCVCGGHMTKDMVGCDGGTCTVQWWHYACVGLTSETIPDGDWYCPRCRRPDSESAGPSTSSGPTFDPSIPAAASSTPGSPGPGPSSDVIDPKENTKKSKPKAKGDVKHKAKPRKKAPARPKTVFTKDDAEEKASSYFITGLSLMKEHPIFDCGSAPALEILAVITQLMLLINCSEFTEFCNISVTELWIVLSSSDSKFLKPEAYDGMWKAFHCFRSTSVKRWQEMLDMLSISVSDHASSISYQYLIQSVFGILIKERNEKDMPPKGSTTCTVNHIDKEEEKVLRYVSGYIPFALLKKYRKQKNSTAQMYCKFLECWMINCVDSGKTFLNYTKEWIEAQDRGGLFKVSDDVYLFFRSMEMVSRIFLTNDNLPNMSEININTVLTDKISTNFRVQTYWCSLIDGKVSGDVSKKFLDIIIKFYIRLRCKAFLKVYLDIRKATNKQVSKKGDKALRKDL